MLVICLFIISPLDLYSQQAEENSTLSDPFSNSTLFGDKDKNSNNQSDDNRDQIFYDTTGVNTNVPMFFNYQSLNGTTVSGNDLPNDPEALPIDDYVIYLLPLSVVIIYRKKLFFLLKKSVVNINFLD